MERHGHHQQEVHLTRGLLICIGPLAYLSFLSNRHVDAGIPLIGACLLVLSNLTLGVLFPLLVALEEGY
jgi:hypothetical protein